MFEVSWVHLEFDAGGFRVDFFQVLSYKSIVREDLARVVKVRETFDIRVTGSFDKLIDLINLDEYRVSVLCHLELFVIDDEESIENAFAAFRKLDHSFLLLAGGAVVHEVDENGEKRFQDWFLGNRDDGFWFIHRLIIFIV